MDQLLVRELLERVARVQPIIAAEAAGAEQNRRIADAVYDALLEQDLFSLLAPRALGGIEASPTTAYTVWEAVARIDAAAAWNLAQAQAGVLMSARLGASGHQKLYGAERQPIFAGAAFPVASAKRVKGGFSVTGRAPFASGCHRADWLALSILPTLDGKPETDANTGGPAVRMAFFPREAVEIMDTWHTMGMRGTGSADICVNEAFVPEELVLSFSGPLVTTPEFSGPLYRLGTWPVIHGEAVVSIGIAAAAIDLLADLAGAKTPTGSTGLLRDRELVQYNIGRARALVDAARAYLHQSASTAFAAAAQDQPVTADMKIAMQLAACNTAESCARAVDLVFDAAGSSAFRTEMGFERLFRDAHVATQHATKSSARYISAGRMILGLAPDTPLLAR